MFDLAQLDTTRASEEGAVLEVRHPVSGAVLTTEDGQAVTVRLAGMDSRRAKRAEQDISDRRVKRTGGRRAVTSEEWDVERLEFLASVTLGWVDGLALDGRPLEFNLENAKRLYERLPWLREQAQAFVDDRANFLRASPTS